MTEVPITFVSSHSAKGGAEWYLRRLMAELGNAWIYDVICLQDGPLVSALENDGHEVTVIDVPARPPGLLTSLRPLRRHLRARSAGVVHANGIKAAFACALATLGTGHRVMWVKHDFSFDGAFANSLGASVDRIVGVSHAVVAGLRGPAARRATFVHTGIDHVETDRAHARRALLAETGWPENSFIVGSVGRLDPAKGHTELIRAAALLSLKVPSTRVAIVGAPDRHHVDMKRRLQDTVREQGLANRVAILGERDEVRTAIAGFDVGVIPTIATRRGGREGFSLVALEMLDAGTPVVAFRSGALPEVLDRCGSLVEEGSIEGLAASIAAIAEDSDLAARLSECGKARVRSAFTVERWIEEMKDEYKRLDRSG